jgi:hypothetical protein
MRRSVLLAAPVAFTAFAACLTGNGTIVMNTTWVDAPLLADGYGKQKPRPRELNKYLYILTWPLDLGPVADAYQKENTFVEGLKLVQKIELITARSFVGANGT